MKPLNWHFLDTLCTANTILQYTFLSEPEYRQSDFRGGPSPQSDEDRAENQTKERNHEDVQ